MSEKLTEFLLLRHNFQSKQNAQNDETEQQKGKKKKHCNTKPQRNQQKGKRTEANHYTIIISPSLN